MNKPNLLVNSPVGMINSLTPAPNVQIPA